MAIVRGCDFPDDLAYDNDLGLWFRVVGTGSWEVGMTPFGLARAGEVYMFNSRPPGRTIEAGRAFALIEVAKSVLALRCPFDCAISAVNEALEQRPAALNRDPYAHWLCRLDVVPSLAARQAQEMLVCGSAVVPRAIALMDLNAFDGPAGADPGVSA
jgi:glycine cleavage system H protein